MKLPDGWIAALAYLILLAAVVALALITIVVAFVR